MVNSSGRHNTSGHVGILKSVQMAGAKIDRQTHIILESKSTDK